MVLHLGQGNPQYHRWEDEEIENCPAGKDWDLPLGGKLGMSQ